MTQEQAEELQVLMGNLAEGESLETPEHLEKAVQNLVLHNLVDAKTAIRH